VETEVVVVCIVETLVVVVGVVVIDVDVLAVVVVVLVVTVVRIVLVVVVVFVETALPQISQYEFMSGCRPVQLLPPLEDSISCWLVVPPLVCSSSSIDPDGE
jgi:hypothetical protein